MFSGYAVNSTSFNVVTRNYLINYAFVYVYNLKHPWKISDYFSLYDLHVRSIDCLFYRNMMMLHECSHKVIDLPSDRSGNKIILTFSLDIYSFFLWKYSTKIYFFQFVVHAQRQTIHPQNRIWSTDIRTRRKEIRNRRSH